MRFRQYDSNEATLKEWARQLNIATRGVYPLYESVEGTLNHWKDTLNITIGINTFGIKDTVDGTLYDWENKLNAIYNQ